MIWRCHSIPCFHFYFLFRNNGIREQLYQNDFCCCYSEICSKFFLNNYKTPWEWHMKDTLQLKILPTWINVGVEPAPRHLTYCSMLFFLSNKPSFCYSNNFCRNLFTFLCLKDVPLLINISNVFSARTFLFQPSSPLIFDKTLVLVNAENCWC